jgi:hypothetical protein
MGEKIGGGGERGGEKKDREPQGLGKSLGDEREIILAELQKIFDAGGENALLHEMQLLRNKGTIIKENEYTRIRGWK